MKKKLVTPLLISIAVATVLFFAGAFITMELNPVKWDSLGRMMYVMFVLAGTAFSFAIANQD